MDTKGTRVAPLAANRHKRTSGPVAFKAGVELKYQGRPHMHCFYLQYSFSSQLRVKGSQEMDSGIKRSRWGGLTLAHAPTPSCMPL